MLGIPFQRGRHRKFMDIIILFQCKNRLRQRNILSGRIGQGIGNLCISRGPTGIGYFQHGIAVKRIEVCLRCKIKEIGFRQSKNSHITQDTAYRMMGVSGSIRDIVYTVSYIQLYLIFRTRTNIIRHVRFPTGKAAMMLTDLFSVY